MTEKRKERRVLDIDGCHHGFGKAQCPAAEWHNGANDYYCRWAGERVCVQDGFPTYCPLLKKAEVKKK